MTLLLVMLHTGTMFAVIVYFWQQWRRAYFATADAFKRFAIRAVWATFLTGIIGYPHHQAHREDRLPRRAQGRDRDCSSAASTSSPTRSSPPAC